jgi:hypothetical protein
MAASLGTQLAELSVDKSSARAAVREAEEFLSVEAVAGKFSVETVKTDDTSLCVSVTCKV